MDVDATIYDALRAAIQKHGSRAAFARAASIDKTMPAGYLAKFDSGKTPWISDANWETIFPVLAAVSPQIRDDPRYWPRSRFADGAGQSNVTRAAAPSHSVRVYGFANSAPAIGEVLGDIPPENEHECKRVLVDSDRAVAAFRVAGQSMEPDGIFDDSLVVCEPVADPKELPPGCIVVCKVDDTLYCKHWRLVGSTILLQSSAHGGKEIELTDREPDWVLRAIQVVREL